MAGCFLWERGSNNGTTWSEAHSQHGNAHYYDIIKFTTRPKETIKIETPYIRRQLRVENLLSSVSIKITHLHLVTIPYTFFWTETDDRFLAYGILYQITFDARYVISKLCLCQSKSHVPTSILLYLIRILIFTFYLSKRFSWKSVIAN